MEPQNLSTQANPHHHAVKFYGSDDSLFTTVAGFLADGLVAGQPAIVIATDGHQRGILDGLSSRFINVNQARRTGDLVILDAHELLEMFTVGGKPNEELFEQHVGGLIAQILRDRPRTAARAYGEMVDILWKRGQLEAALALELMWNKLAVTHRFALLCGYAMGQFYKQSEQFQQICDQHSHVVSIDTNVVPFSRRRSA